MTGYLAGRFEALGPESAAALNRFVYLFALHLPSSSSRPGRQSKRFSMASHRRLRRWISCDAPHFTVDWTDLVSARSGNAERAGLTAIFANVVYMGLPLLMTAYGPDGALPAILAALIMNVMFIGGAMAAATSPGAPFAFRSLAGSSQATLRRSRGSSC
jgi:malonate transporter and related proteins